MAEDFGGLVSEIDNGGGFVAGEGFGGATAGVRGGEEDGADFFRDLGEEGMVGDADADGVEMIVVEMVEAWVFGEDEGELAGDVFVDEGLGFLGDGDIF